VDPLRFDGRVAIVTGAGRGMGRIDAMYLSARGAKVVVNDLGTSLDGEGADTNPAQQVVEEIRAAGGEAVANFDNVATTEGAEAMVSTALERFGTVDIVVNNAGIQTHFEFPETNLADFMKHLMVHLIGSFNVSRAAWPHMVEKGYGRVVMISSSALLGHRRVLSYASAKAGQIGLMRSLALSGAPHNIKVNAVTPVAHTRMGKKNVTATGSPLAPEYVSTVVAVLAHELCPVSAEIIGVGAGRVSRLFIADTVGHIDRELTAERLLQNWDKVMDERGYYVPTESLEHSNRLRTPDLVASRTSQ
jgi:NAD(P)-dependent dehydrogenase (short-subunit alcohol dehydrogenase family)